MSEHGNNNGAERKRYVSEIMKQAKAITRPLRTAENGGICPDCNWESTFCVCTQRDMGLVHAPKPAEVSAFEQVFGVPEPGLEEVSAGQAAPAPEWPTECAHGNPIYGDKRCPKCEAADMAVKEQAPELAPLDVTERDRLHGVIRQLTQQACDENDRFERQLEQLRAESQRLREQLAMDDGRMK